MRMAGGSLAEDGGSLEAAALVEHGGWTSIGFVRRGLGAAS